MDLSEYERKKAIRESILKGKSNICHSVKSVTLSIKNHICNFRLYFRYYIK